jgi:hypothetical protein
MIDRSVLNEDTVGRLTDMGLSIFAPLCGRNRGAFVLDPADGHTYGCTKFPASFAEEVGVSPGVVRDANGIKDGLKQGNITAAAAVDLFDLLTGAVYFSTPNHAADPYACDVAGAATLNCGKGRSPTGVPIRAVTLAGLFVPAEWATGGIPLTIHEARQFYSIKDFDEMVALGINTVQIPLPLSAFVDYSNNSEVVSVLEAILQDVADSGLDAILVLVADIVSNKAVNSAVAYADTNPAVLGVTLPNKDSDVIQAARSASDLLPLFLPINGGELNTLNPLDDNMYASLDMNHASVVADIASSSSEEDRSKLFYHEATSCIARSPIEYANCYRDMPIFISGGFDLSIDDCVQKGTKKFKNYGQCDRFNETIGSKWWSEHRASFAARQLFAFERGLGWSFATWKLFADDDTPDLIDDPAELLALKNVAAAGLFPSLKKRKPAAFACLNPPEADFVLGDDTLAPSAAPPPACVEGCWWNFDINDCECWIPPSAAPVTSAPTQPCPECPLCPPAPYTQQDLRKSAVTGAIGGAAVGLVVTFLLLKICGRNSGGYSQIPDN